MITQPSSPILTHSRSYPRISLHPFHSSSLLTTANSSCHHYTSTSTISSTSPSPSTPYVYCVEPPPYSPQHVDSSNCFNSKLVQTPGGVNTLTLTAYCPGSGNRLAGTTHTTLTQTAPITTTSTNTTTTTTRLTPQHRRQLNFILSYPVMVCARS